MGGAVRLYTKSHTWVLAEGNRARVGLSDFAQRELGEIAYVELPSVGRRLEAGEPACTIDAMKSSSEIDSPLSGTVVEANAALGTDDGCATVNRDPLGAGWLFVIEMDDPRQLTSLLSEQQYAAFTEGE
jgi:glycine cleavage system H protein